MNSLNEKLRIIQQQKAIMERQAKVYARNNDEQELYDISKKIMELDKEESSILKELNRREL